MMMLMMIKSEAKCVSTHCVGVSDIYICMYQHQQWKQQVIRARAKAKTLLFICHE